MGLKKEQDWSQGDQETRKEDFVSWTSREVLEVGESREIIECNFKITWWFLPEEGKTRVKDDAPKVFVWVT